MKDIQALYGKVIKPYENILISRLSMKDGPKLCPSGQGNCSWNHEKWIRGECVCVCAHARVHFSCVQLFVTPWTVARQVPLSMELSSQEHWSGLSFPSPGDLPNPGIEPISPASPALQVNSLPLSHWGARGDYILPGKCDMVTFSVEVKNIQVGLKYQYYFKMTIWNKM